jgi:hypothetical protein
MICKAFEAVRRGHLPTFGLEMGKDLGKEPSSPAGA